MASPVHGLDRRVIDALSAAGQALDMGRTEQARLYLAQAVALQPGHPEVLRMRAGVASQQGQHSEAVALMTQAAQQRPDDPVYLNTLGTIQGNAGLYDQAVESLQRACRLQPGQAMAWYNLGVMLVRSVRNKEAIAALEQAVRIAPQHAAARAQLADLLRTQGRNEQATVQYRQLLSERPWTGMAWWGLADMKNQAFSTDDIDAMRYALGHASASEDDRVAIGFALAKAYDDHGRYAESLQALGQANALARRQQQWNGPAFERQMNGFRQAFAAARFDSDADQGREVIFVTSLPRSGSTLVEQILASHSLVDGSGELADLPQVLAEESRQRGQPFVQWASEASQADWLRLGQRYLQRTARWRQQRPITVDKLPSNWMYIDAIRLMLPQARIICCRRDALETCFSCYRQRLAHNEYSRTFADLAGFWRQFDQSAREGTSRHPAHVMAFEYERLLSDPAGTIGELLAFCGLPFEQACVDFHLNPREVRSPSANQVRQPLRRDRARADRYGALLDPLRAALGLPPYAPASLSG